MTISFSSPLTSFAISTIPITECGKRLDIPHQEVGDPDAGECDCDVRDIEDRPVWDLDEVDYMALQELRCAKDPIGEIAQDATKKYTEGHCPPQIDDFAGEDQESCSDDQGEDSEEDGEIRTDIEGSTTIRRVIEAKEFSEDFNGCTTVECRDCPPLRTLIKSHDAQ